MDISAIASDPYNLIITGVGGQGNVLASRVVGDMLVRQGFEVTIGETFGASQRGGSVMSHLRVSQRGGASPQIPRGRAHMVLSLEPIEAIRVLHNYGNREVKVISNMRPVRPLAVICGERSYPAARDIQAWLGELSRRAWCMDTTEAARELGSPIFANVILVGALAATGDLPLPRETFEAVMQSRMAAAKVALNLEAFDRGREMIDPA